MAGQSRQPSQLAAVVAELGLGLLGGSAGAALLGLGGGWLLSVLVPNMGMGLLGIMLYLGMLGFAVGAPLGVALAGRWLRQDGSWAFALGGGVLGGVFVMGIAASGVLGPYTTLALALLAGVSLVCAVVGYNLRRPAAGVAR